MGELLRQRDGSQTEHTRAHLLATGIPERLTHIFKESGSSLLLLVVGALDMHTASPTIPVSRGRPSRVLGKLDVPVEVEDCSQLVS